MLRLSRFLHGETGRVLMSIILGLGLASLFKTVCKGKNCLVYKAPPLDDIDNKIYKFDDKCYSYKSVTTKCNNQEMFVDME